MRRRGPLRDCVHGWQMAGAEDFVRANGGGREEGEKLLEGSVRAPHVIELHDSLFELLP